MKIDLSLETVTRPIKDEDEDFLRKDVYDDEYIGILANFIDILVSRRGFGVSDPRDMIASSSIHDEWDDSDYEKAYIHW